MKLDNRFRVFDCSYYVTSFCICQHLFYPTHVFNRLIYYILHSKRINGFGAIHIAVTTETIMIIFGNASVTGRRGTVLPGMTICLGNGFPLLVWAVSTNYSARRGHDKGLDADHRPTHRGSP